MEEFRGVNGVLKSTNPARYDLTCVADSLHLDVICHFLSTFSIRNALRTALFERALHSVRKTHRREQSVGFAGSFRQFQGQDSLQPYSDIRNLHIPPFCLGPEEIHLTD